MTYLPGIVDVGFVGNHGMTHRVIRQLVYTTDFPEAGEDCCDVDRLYEYGESSLAYLDQDAINEIRLNNNHGKNGDQLLLV
ncbi:unnamed protein product [Absidia cylindrospora]